MPVLASRSKSTQLSLTGFVLPGSAGCAGAPVQHIDVFSLDHDGHLWYAGRRDPEVGALVVSQIAPEALADAARARLSAFKVPTLWLVVPDPDGVPMSATGKVDKPALQRLLRESGVRCTRS